MVTNAAQENTHTEMQSVVHDTQDVMPDQSRKVSLLGLPSEILTEILTAVLEPDVLSETTVRWMIIRAYYQTRFLPVTPLNRSSASLLVVCHKITASVLPIVYGLPYWRCDCHLEHLWLQIGPKNISQIKRMYVSVDDIKQITEAVEIEAAGANAKLPETTSNMRLISLEELGCDAFEWEVLLDLCARNGPEASRSRNVGPSMRRSALRLCENAEKIIRLHGKLNVLVQEKLNASSAGTADMGESDAVDISRGRIQWRFLKSEQSKRTNEEVVDLLQLIDLLKEAVHCDDVAFALRPKVPHTMEQWWTSRSTSLGAS